MIFGEKNIKVIVSLDLQFPDYLFGFTNVPDILNIHALSTKLNVKSPLPKLNIVHKSTGQFGWAGSTGYFDAASKSKSHESVSPKFFTKVAVQQVVCEVEEAAEGIEGMRSSNYNNIISRIELSFPTCLDCNTAESPLLCPSQTASIVLSPDPTKKHKRSRSKNQSYSKSNKGSATLSHRLNTSKLEISIKVGRVIDWLLYYIHVAL